MKKTIVAGLFVAAAFLGAPAASADSQGYLDELAAAGVHPFLTMTEGNLVTGGLHLCDLMRSGMTPEQAAGSLGVLSGVLGAPAATAAQHQLCPDTIH